MGWWTGVIEVGDGQGGGVVGGGWGCVVGVGGGGAGDGGVWVRVGLGRVGWWGEWEREDGVGLRVGW